VGGHTAGPPLSDPFSPSSYPCPLSAADAQEQSEATGIESEGICLPFDRRAVLFSLPMYFSMGPYFHSPLVPRYPRR